MLAVGLGLAATLCGQHHRFSWQEACFKNPAAPFCAGNDFAVKKQPATKVAQAPSPANQVRQDFYHRLLV